MKQKIVYFFCINNAIDPVAKNVLNYLMEHYTLVETDMVCDDHKVLSYENENYLFYCVQMDDVLSHNYQKYLPVMNKYFFDCVLAGVVNWHAGENAPSNILTVHSTGDVPSGIFATSNPTQVKCLFQSIERNRKKFELSNYCTMVEATHWSGIPYSQKPELIAEFNVSVYDIEIGSEKESWEDEAAIQVLAESLFDLNLSGIEFQAIIGVGGKHFEPCFSELLSNEKLQISVGHILPNQWIANESYDGEKGKQKLRDCIASIQGKVTAIVFHDNLKGSYKQLCRDIANEYGIPCFKHKILRDTEQLLTILDN